MFTNLWQNPPSLTKLYRPFLPFADNDVSGKVWPRLITTQQAEIYPEVSLGFATVTPVHIYVHLA